MDVNPEKSPQSFDEWFTVKRDHKATGDLQLGFTFKAPDHESSDTELRLGSKTIDLSRMNVGEEQVPSCLVFACILPLVHAG